MISLAVLTALVALIALIVKAAGWRFALKRFAGALLVLVIVTFGVSVLLRFASADEDVQKALESLDVSPNAQPCVTALGTGATKEAVLRSLSSRIVLAAITLAVLLARAAFKSIGNLIEQRRPDSGDTNCW